MILSWIRKRRDLSLLEVRALPISKINNWISTGKKISHENNSYFSIIGVEIHNKQNQENWEQPIILQQEKGILGFIIQENKILLQAKTEPGNVNGTQIAPSVQATTSNYTRVHGGDKTKFLKYFLESDYHNSESISKTLQSEQGTRFMNKSNWNSIVRLNSGDVLEDMDDRFR